MEITSAKYVKINMEGENRDGNNSAVIATIDGVSMEVPLDPANRHYAAILEWSKEDSNEIQAAD